ncbi:hypothetical protein [Acetobacter persici]|uniref:Uncharacterized protein n=1 Tax=Acetobacter persici TaxID=1076596 RepID=A0A1U9LEN0_9PROT|nr:hypothetical protein [Acetobacter persici]AQT04849.1 hypothetical protein A0U91_07860 [Acetobacter persici]
MARSAAGMALRQQISIMTTRAMTSPEIRARVADKCRELRDAEIRAGRASVVYQTRTDGHANRPEEAVTLQNGRVTYIFSYIAQAAQAALDWCRSHSPVRSGSYRDGWVVRVDGALWTRQIAAIPPASRVEVVNTMPYSRKIEVGGQRTSVPPGIVEAARGAVQRQVPAITAGVEYIRLTSGQDARGGALPYVLKAQGIASGLSYDKKSRQWGRKHKARKTRRADRSAGQQMTYPALVLTEGDTQWQR